MSDDEIKLKPCPFCGSHNVKIREFEPECCVITCDDCNAEGGYYNSENESTQPHEAAEFWNRRAALVAVADATLERAGRAFYRRVPTEWAPTSKEFVSAMRDALDILEGKA